MHLHLYTCLNSYYLYGVHDEKTVFLIVLMHMSCAPPVPSPLSLGSIAGCPRQQEAMIPNGAPQLPPSSDLTPVKLRKK